MAAKRKIRIVYVTSSPYKKEENAVFADNCALGDGTLVRNLSSLTFAQFRYRKS
jgi:hypothetical protein